MKSPMIGNSSSTFVLLLIAGVWLFLTTSTNAAPSSDLSYNYPLDVQKSLEKENILRSLAQLKQVLLAEEDLENSKRGLDLGLGRGYSGSQAAKHLMGLAAANFAGGPGRRRRSDEDA